jgi:predicted TIM-barrel fold metal-dependent hydrolase
MEHAEALRRVRALREAYRRLSSALPWLDAARWDGDPPAFAGYARDVGLPSVRRTRANEALPSEAHPGPVLAVYDPAASPPLSPGEPLWAALADHRTPLVVLHTDADLADIADFAAAHPALPAIIESGPLKLLYHFAQLQDLLTAHRNLYLCTYNLCNWLALERLYVAGLGDRLLFGTHAPRYNAHCAMGPIALADLPWETKCDLAGNNLRRLLGVPLVTASEPSVEPVAPFIIDAHTHSGPNGRFPVPDEDFEPADWLRFMDRRAVERLCLVPMESLHDPEAGPGSLTAGLRAGAGGRISYLEVFHPQAGPEHLLRIEASLRDPDCVGVKLHPSFHEVSADDERYEPVYELAERLGVPLLTHSWDVSATNPRQELSHPDRFRPHLRLHPRTRLVLGHAGGRPGALEAVVGLCRDFAGVSVDLAGDYFDSGLVECLVTRLGADRVLYGSDMNWLDPRANLAAVLAADISDEDALAILRVNAARMYLTRQRYSTSGAASSPLTGYSLGTAPP